MHDDRRLVEDRLDRVLRERVAPAAYPDSVPLDLSAWLVPDEPVPVAEAVGAAYRPVAVGAAWGRPWSTTWFRATGTVPAHWAGRRVEALFDLGFTGADPGFQAEALVYDADGRPLKGIAPRNRYVPVANPCTGGETVTLLVEAAANPDVLGAGFLPNALGEKAGTEPLYRLRAAELAILDEDAWHLALDLSVLAELMRELAVADPRRHDLLRAAERALDLLDADAGWPAARDALAPVLSRPAHASAHTLSAVGHAHIDSAWLWPLRETVRKCARTFANVTALAEDYPELVFACSQAQQYAWMKEHHPEVFARIRKAVAAGQWAPVGGMWVEADGNLPGGEALARQLVHGKRFFLDEFGVECAGVWLPDSFGYTAAYPQLARLAGMRWFLTQKLSWNDTDAFPHHTFWWEGLDGSRVFTHFPPVATYNAGFSGAEVARAVRDYAEKGRGTRSLVPFGNGDGGGGPTREMLERARRLRDLEGSARVVVEHPDRFFDAALAEYPDAPVWSGELYLELHRGTYTTQARTKAGNRRAEHLLREAELWAATAAVHSGFPYPYEDLDRLWKAVLLNQFHDILPGSSIAWVHREAEATYARVHGELSGIVAAAQAALAGPSTSDTLVFNAGPFRRAEVCTVDGRPAFVSAPALGAAVVGVRAAVGGGAVVAPVTVTDRDPGAVLDNGLVRVTLDGDGLLDSVYDLVAGREVLAPGSRGNVLRLHPDRPSKWDAWDIERQYRHGSVELTAAATVEVTAAGPLVGAVRVTREFGGSRLEQTVSLRAGSARVDVATDLDWQERQKLLKVAFPLDVHADRSAAEIQFGHVYRPTHANTSWDAARFETYAHRWVHVGEAGYGVALLTDATYGYDATRATRPDGGTTTTVCLSLVRAPQSPDPQADRGRHRFTYALLPGAAVADAVAEGYALNLPLRAVPGAGGAVPGSAGAPPPLVSVDGGGVVVEAVKLADDRSGDVVVRLYESRGGRAKAFLRTGFPIASVSTVDLLERPLPGPPRVEPDGDGAVGLDLRAFEIVTLRLVQP
jgi:alpha-mannosidase